MVEVPHPLTPSLSENSLQSDSTDLTTQKLREHYGFAGASNVTMIEKDIVVFTYFKDGDKHFAIFNLAEAKKLSDQANFTGDTLNSSNKGTITFTNNTKVSVDTNNYSKKPVITTQPTQNQQISPELYIRSYYENDGSDWTVIESFTYSSDNHSDAAVVVSNAHEWNFYLYEIPQNANPYISYSINPPQSGDEWTKISNVRKIGGGKITFTGQSKAAGTKNYTYHYLNRYYVGTNNTNTNNNTLSNQDKINQQLPSGQYVETIIYTAQRQGGAVLVKDEGGASILYFYGFDSANPVREKSIYDTRYQDDGGERISDIRMLGNGRLSFRVSNFGYTFTRTYNYFSGQFE